MEDINFVTLVAAILGAGGIGAVLREVFAGIAKMSRGVSVKEDRRRADIVQQRDDAIGRERDERAEKEEAIARADMEARNRRRLEEYAATLRRQLIEDFGVSSSELASWPTLEMAD